MSLFTLSEQYGQAVNVGGNYYVYRFNNFTSSKQVYDLPSEATLESSVQIQIQLEIQRVFNQGQLHI